MKISIKFFTGSAVSVGLIVAILIGHTTIMQQITQTFRDKTREKSETIKTILATDNTLKSEIIALKDIVLFKSQDTKIEEFQNQFIKSLNQLEQLMPNAPEISVIRRRHQLLKQMAIQLTQRSSSLTYLADSQQYFRTINSFNKDIELFLDQLMERAYEEQHLLKEDLDNLNQVQKIVSFVVVMVILMLFIGKFILVWRPMLESLHNLHLGTAEIADGNFKYRLDIHTGDEIEELAQSFNDMASKLFQSRETLLKNTELTNINQHLELEIAERKQAEFELQKALQELQNTQAQLIQTEKMSSLGQLVAGVAHEINNPVNFIYGNITYVSEYAEKLLELIYLYQQDCSQTSEAIAEKVAEIDLEFLQIDLLKILSSMKMGSQRIQQIVLSLRNFSRLDEAEMKEVDIHEGIESTLLILQNRFKAKSLHPNIEIIKKYGRLPLINCHAGQLNQVFMNIINNAIDALEESTVSEQWTVVSGKTTNNPQITIQTELINNNLVVVRIADNGPGMTERVMQKLFDPFFTTKPVGQGTGLGLSISYQIVVEKHCGVLRCESKLGQGTEFWIEIPLHQQQKHGFSPALTKGV